MKKVINSDALSLILAVLAVSFGTLGVLDYMDQIAHQKKLSTPFASFGLKSPSLAVAMIEDQRLERLTEVQRQQILILKLKAKLKEAEEKSRLSMFYPGRKS